MNERIQKLAEQALQLVANEHTNGDESRLNTDSYHVKDLIQEKFAELLIKECAKAADEGMAQVTMRVEWPSYHIKKHFGVE